MDRPTAIRLVGLAGVAAISVYLGFFAFSPLTAVMIVRASSVYVVAGLFALLVWFVSKTFPRDWLWWKNLLHRHRWGVVCVLVVSMFLITREPEGFKVVSDEVILAASAMGLHFDCDPAVVVRGHELLGVFTQMDAYLDKRPCFYPFLVSCLHTVLGYRVENSFLLNRMLAFVLSGLLYGIGCRLKGRRGGILAVALLASIPLVAQNANSGGLGMLNMVMIMASIHLAIVYLEQPTWVTQGSFLCAVLLLAHTRYESCLYVLICAIVLLLSFIRAKKLLLFPPLLLAPVGLILVPLHRNAFVLEPETLWQLPPGVASPFSLSFISNNLADAYTFFFHFSQTTYGSPLVAGLGVVAVALYFLALYRKQRRRVPIPRTAKVLGLFALGPMASLLLVLCYYWGSLQSYEASRFALPVLLILIPFIVYSYYEFYGQKKALTLGFVICCVYMFSFSIPASAKQLPSLRNYHVRRMDWSWKKYQELPPGKYFVISQNRLFWNIHQIAAIEPWKANNILRQFEYHIQHKTFTDILVFQKMISDPKTGEIRALSRNDLSWAFELETLAEVSLRPFVFCRMSRVVSFDLDRHDPSAQQDKRLLPYGEDMEPISSQYIREYVYLLP